MSKFTLLVSILFSLITGLRSQSLKLWDVNTHKDITNDSIVIQSKYNNGWVGYESLDLIVAVENTSNKIIETGAKKMEFDAFQADVSHVFCFAGGCFFTSVFVSPLHVSIAPGKSDTSFIAHYMFDNSIHIRGINHVAYVFYDVANPNDSAIVYVTYNSNISNMGIKEANSNLNAFSLPYPNPANNFVILKRNLFMDRPIKISVRNILGEEIESALIPPGTETFSLNTTLLSNGFYMISFYEDDCIIETKTLSVKR